jgi:hypothetical protein
VQSRVESKKNITAADWLCNGLTDHLADKVANLLRPLPYDARRIEGYERRAFAVLRRLAFINADCIRTAPDQVPISPLVDAIPMSILEHTAALERGLALQGHNLTYDGDWVRCKTCCKRRTRRFSCWSRLPCCEGGLAALGKRKTRDEPIDKRRVEAKPNPVHEDWSMRTSPLDEEDDVFDNDAEDDHGVPEAEAEGTLVEAPAEGESIPIAASAGEIGTKQEAARRRKENKEKSKTNRTMSKRNHQAAWNLMLRSLTADTAPDASRREGKIGAHPWHAIHASHDLRVVAGVAVCARCGGWSSLKRSQKLRQHCTARIKKGTVTAFRRVLRARNPVQSVSNPHKRTRGAAKGKLDGPKFAKGASESSDAAERRRGTSCGSGAEVPLAGTANVSGHRARGVRCRFGRKCRAGSANRNAGSVVPAIHESDPVGVKRDHRGLSIALLERVRAKELRSKRVTAPMHV